LSLKLIFHLKSSASISTFNGNDANPKFLSFACCAACEADESLLNSVWYSQQLHRLAYALDGQQLSCADPSNADALMAKRDSDWCQHSPDYSHSGLRSLVKCPGSDAYHGKQLNPRHTAKTATSQNVDCGATYCSGHGECESAMRECTCNAGYVGMDCSLGE
jgi:hypothetical protein